MNPCLLKNGMIVIFNILSSYSHNFYVIQIIYHASTMQNGRVNQANNRKAIPRVVRTFKIDKTAQDIKL